MAALSVLACCPVLLAGLSNIDRAWCIKDSSASPSVFNSLHKWQPARVTTTPPSYRAPLLPIVILVWCICVWLTAETPHYNDASSSESRHPPPVYWKVRWYVTHTESVPMTTECCRCFKRLTYALSGYVLHCVASCIYTTDIGQALIQVSWTYPTRCDCYITVFRTIPLQSVTSCQLMEVQRTEHAGMVASCL